MGRKPLGKQRRIQTSIRIEPDIKKAFEERYGGVQKAIDALIDGFRTDRTRWLENLKEFTCPTCGNKTIFRAGCLDCEEK